MDLYHHQNPLFTKWIVHNRLLHEPYVVIDIGCQGGAHPRWGFLGEFLDWHGFDPIAEVINELEQNPPSSIGRHTFHNLALGNEDGHRRFWVKPDKFGSSFYADHAAADPGDEREVAIRRLDSLYKEGLIPRGDHIKLDCEGFEPEILQGAQEYLIVSDLLGVETETNFMVSPVCPRTHFQAVNDLLVEHRLLVFDLSMLRTPSAAFLAALAKHPWPRRNPMTEAPHLAVGRPTTYNVFFCRDFIAERADPDTFLQTGRVHPAPSIDKLIKAIITFELYGLPDCAVDLAMAFSSVLQERFDVAEAVRLLVMPPPHARWLADVVLCLEMIAALRTRIYNSWSMRVQRFAKPIFMGPARWALRLPFRLVWKVSRWLFRLTPESFQHNVKTVVLGRERANSIRKNRYRDA
jgi:FkbM family methyltransferase